MILTNEEFCIIRFMQALGVLPSDYLLMLHHSVGTMAAQGNEDGVKMLECLIEKLESKDV